MQLLIERPVLKREKVEAEENLKRVTWLKRSVVKYIVDNYLKREETVIEKRHEKKLQNLRREKPSIDGTRPNPNKIIINLTNTKLTNEQYCALYNNTCSSCIFIGRELCVIKVHTHG